MHTLKGKCKQNKLAKVLLKLFHIQSSVFLNHFLTQLLMSVFFHIILSFVLPRGFMMQQFLKACSQLSPPEVFSQAAHSVNYDAGIFRIYQEVTREGLQATTRTPVPSSNGSACSHGYGSQGVLQSAICRLETQTFSLSPNA